MKRVMMMFVVMFFCGFFFVANSVSAIRGGENVKTFERISFSKIIEDEAEIKLRSSTQADVLFFLQQQRVIIQDLATVLENLMMIMERASELGEVKLFALAVEAADNIKKQFDVLKPTTKNLERVFLFLEGEGDLGKALPLMEKIAEKLVGKVVPLREDLVKRIFPAIEKEVNKIVERRGKK